jgi:hypothetical protein
MTGKFTSTETVNALKAIFEKHINERVCVIGTVCCGKTTLIKHLGGYNCIDMDDEFWPQATKKEIEYFSQVPFTKEMSNSINKLVYERISVKPGFPLFGVVILDCEVVIYLDIAENLLKEHCKKRGTHSYSDALFIKQVIEKDWNNHKLKNDKVFYYLIIKE